MISFIKKRLRYANNRTWTDLYSHAYTKYNIIFLGFLMRNGLKFKAISLLNEIKFFLKLHEKKDPYFVFLVGMLRITPSVINFTIQLPKRTATVPFPITARRRVLMAVKWVFRILKGRKQKVSRLLADVIFLSVYNKGPAVRAKKRVYRIAMKNKHWIKFYDF